MWVISVRLVALLEGPGQLWSDLWQELAQIYVAITHTARGNRKGAERLMQKAGERPTAYAATGDTTYGLDLDAVTACTRGAHQSPYQTQGASPLLALPICGCHDRSVRAEISNRVRDAATGFAAALVLVTLVVLAIRADVAAPHASTWLVVLDVATGMAFVVAAALAPGSQR